jgi:hypothetical protein
VRAWPWANGFISVGEAGVLERRQQLDGLSRQQASLRFADPSRPRLEVAFRV